MASLVTVAFADKAVCDTLLAGHESRIAWGQIRHEIGPVHRFLVRDIGVEHGDSERAAELPGQIDQPRCLGDLRASDRREHDEVDWGEQKAQPQAAHNQAQACVRFSGQGGQMAQHPHRDNKNPHAEENQYARVYQRLCTV